MCVVFQRRDNAQPSCAGLFIHAHLLKDYTGAWIHVDMAGPVHQVLCLLVSVLCLVVALSDCIRSRYLGGLLIVIARNLLVLSSFLMDIR